MSGFRARRALAVLAAGAALMGTAAALAMDRRAPDSALERKAPAPEAPAQAASPAGVPITAGEAKAVGFSDRAPGSEGGAPAPVAPSFAPDKAQTLILGFSDVKAREGAAPAIRVFIGKPDATAQTPTDDPHYAGEISFYPLVPQDGTRRFELPIGETLKRLEAAGALPTSMAAAVTLVAIDQAAARAKPTGLAAPASAPEPGFTTTLSEIGVGEAPAPQ